MQEQVLVAFATRHGSTREIAQAVAEVIRETGAEVDLMAADQVTDVEPYRAVLLASPIYGDKLLDPAVEFVRRFQEPLKSKRVAYALNGLTLRQDTPENRAKMRATIAHLPLVSLVDVGLFGGTGKHLPWLMRLGLRLMGMPPRDLRDWEAIRAWTRGLFPRLGLG